MKILWVILLMLTVCVQGGPFPPAAEEEGSDAVSNDEARIVGWATTVESYEPDVSVSESFQDSSQALGPAEGTSFEVCSLGPGGSLTVSFGRAISNRLGPELAVFENSFSDTFLELAFVEVSSDGVHFVRFPSQSLTPAAVGSFGAVDPTDVSGLAGKYRQGFGTPFDFSDLPEDPFLDLGAVRFVRLVDVTGGQVNDSSGNVIYDPFPTVVSAGFDCDGIALLAPQSVPVSDSEVTEGEFTLSWQSEIGLRYAVEASASLMSDDWSELASWIADEEKLSFSFSIDGVSRQFFRVVSSE